MNERMRRYLDEDWNEQQEQELREQYRAQETRATPDPRRQKAKEWGRAMFKFHKQKRRERQPK